MVRRAPRRRPGSCAGGASDIRCRRADFPSIQLARSPPQTTASILIRRKALESGARVEPSDAGHSTTGLCWRCLQPEAALSSADPLQVAAGRGRRHQSWLLGTGTLLTRTIVNASPHASTDSLRCTRLACRPPTAAEICCPAPIDSNRPHLQGQGQSVARRLWPVAITRHNERLPQGHGRASTWKIAMGKAQHRLRHPVAY